MNMPSTPYLLVLQLAAFIPLLAVALTALGLCFRYRESSPRATRLLAGLITGLLCTAGAARLVGVYTSQLLADMPQNYERIGVLASASHLLVGAVPLTLFILGCAVIGWRQPRPSVQHL